MTHRIKDRVLGTKGCQYIEFIRSSMFYVLKRLSRKLKFFTTHFIHWRSDSLSDLPETYPYPREQRTKLSSEI